MCLLYPLETAIAVNFSAFSFFYSVYQFVVGNMKLFQEYLFTESKRN